MPTHCPKILCCVVGHEPQAYLGPVQEEEVQQLQALPHHLGVRYHENLQQQGKGSLLVQLLAVGWALLCYVAQHCQDLHGEAMRVNKECSGKNFLPLPQKFSKVAFKCSSEAFPTP